MLQSPVLPRSARAVDRLLPHHTIDDLFDDETARLIAGSLNDEVSTTRLRFSNVGTRRALLLLETCWFLIVFYDSLIAPKEFCLSGNWMPEEVHRFNLTVLETQPDNTHENRGLGH